MKHMKKMFGQVLKQNMVDSIARKYLKSMWQKNMKKVGILPKFGEP